MKGFTIKKVHIKQFLSFYLLFLLYTMISEIWLAVLYTHENWINVIGIITVAILLVSLYTYINTRLSLGIWKYIFYIPFFPVMIGTMLFQPIVFSIFPNPYKTDDLGVGILMMMIAFPHWIAMMLSFLLAHIIKMRRKEG
ncbi:hypothetical protein [Peribacillus sp. Hz7]|uniref:hypothetical protein n=1 Tax=Peribacillus sp. Hz7 TaxID=3344873 RepID=UPI0035CA11F8